MAVSMSSSICSFSGFVLVIFISLKCVVGSFWVAVGLVGSSDKGGGGSCGGGGTWKFVWNELNDGGDGGGSGRIRLLNVGGDGGGKGAPLLLSMLTLLLHFRNASNVFCISKSTPGLGAFSISSFTRSFFSMSSSRSNNPTTGFCASKVEMYSNPSSKGFWRRKIFFAIGSNFCLKLALLSLSLVT